MADRVPRNTLSRHRVIEAALALVDAKGIEALTMPALAAQLGVGTMSLYRHVDDKDDLINGMAAAVFGAVTVPPGAPDDWEGRVVGFLRSFRSEALRHPALARILADRGIAAEPILEQLDENLGILRTAGFSELDAVRAFYSLLSYVFGFLLWELPRVHQQSPASYEKAWTDAVGGLDPEEYPNIHALRAVLRTSASTEQFEYGLSQLVSSLRTRTTRRRRR